MSSNLPERTTGSPFDALKRTDEQGEYWLARDLMRPLGYSTWERFVAVVEKAAESLRIVQGGDVVAEVFRKIAKNRSRQGGRPGEDYRLTRFAAYLTAMAGDDTKPQVAEARIYFAVKTREAEVAPALVAARQVPTHPQALRGWAEEMERAAGLAQQLAIAAPKVAFVDTYVALGDASTFMVVAGQLGVTEPELRQYLTTRGVIHRRTVDQRWSNSNRRMEPVYQWLARSQYVKWFCPKDQLKAPRMHNGQYRTTLYITPVGKAGIEAMMRRRPILGQGEFDIDSEAS